MVERIVKDMNGKEVKADSLYKGLLTNFEKGATGFLRTEDDSFYALVECHSKRGQVYTFISETYGDKIIVDFNKNTVTRK